MWKPLLAAALLALPPGLRGAGCDVSGPAIIGGASTGSNDNHYAQKVSLGAVAVVAQLNFRANTNNPSVPLAFYEDAGGVPGRRILTTASQALSSGQWTAFPLDPRPVLEPGDYWIAVSGEPGFPLGCSPSLGAVYALNTSHPGHADLFEAPTGSHTGYPLNLSHCAAASLAGALDASGLVFLASAPAPASWTAQTVVSFDGVDAARASVDNGQEASLFLSVDGPGELSFRWKADTGGDDSRLIFLVDGSSNTYAAQSHDWSLVTRSLAAGRRQIQWRLIGQDAGTHHGYLDQVLWLPPTPTSTATPSSTDTPSATPSATPSGTPTPSPTVTPTDTPTATPTPTPSASPSATPTASGSATPSATASPTSSVTPTASPSATATLSPVLSATPSPTPTPSFTPGPPFRASGLGRSAFGPVPVARGRALCVHFAAAPLSAEAELYNLAGQRVARAALAGQELCLQTRALAPGLYFGRLRARSAAGEEVRLQKLAVVP